MTSPPILLVEDNPDTIEIVALLLEDMAITTLDIATSYREVAIWLATHTVTPALALIDLHLPDTDGYQVVTDLQRVPRLSTLPLVAFTAHILAHDVTHLQAAGFVGCIEKPIHHDHFKQVIRQVLVGTTAWFHVRHTPAAPPVVPTHLQELLDTQRAAFCTTTPAHVQALGTQWTRLQNAAVVAPTALAPLQRTVHPLVGHAAQLGFAELSQVLCQINTRLRQIQADPSDWLHQRDQITQDFHNVLTLLESLPDTEPRWETP
ncbi:MAG: response regulator [Blastochloris sp.]|nr:response regulator [Blastochloris sp.]